MRKEGRMQNILIVLLVVTIVGMSIGFAAAAFNSTLNITGNVTAKKADWDVHFENYAAKTGEGYVTTGSGLLSSNDTKLTYTVTLEPGEKYGFTIDAVNDGTLDAILKSITFGGDTVPEYLTYAVKVNNTTYTATNTSLNVALAAETGVHPVDVEIEYICPADSTKLPQTDTELTFTLDLGYESVLQTSSN